MSAFQLRFPADETAHWAGRYDTAFDAAVENDVGPFMQREGYLTKPHFLTLTRWKSPRPQQHCAANTDTAVEAATREALALPADETRAAVSALVALRGVSLPTASAILHFGREPYPILDVRALWSLGNDAPARPTLDLWDAYVTFTRDLAAEQDVSMRTLDRALWQFSKETQPRAQPRV